MKNFFGESETLIDLLVIKLIELCHDETLIDLLVVKLIELLGDFNKNYILNSNKIVQLNFLFFVHFFSMEAPKLCDVSLQEVSFYKEHCYRARQTIRTNWTNA